MGNKYLVNELTNFVIESGNVEWKIVEFGAEITNSNLVLAIIREWVLKETFTWTTYEKYGKQQGHKFTRESR